MAWEAEDRNLYMEQYAIYSRLPPDEQSAAGAMYVAHRERFGSDFSGKALEAAVKDVTATHHVMSGAEEYEEIMAMQDILDE